MEAVKPKIVPMRFICDEQLGKLSRWLKILGQDVIYKNNFPDDELITLAERERRILLTRDTRLIPRLGSVSYYFVKENYPADQLREVVERFQDEMRIDVFSRCVDCNRELYEIPKQEVIDKVPPFVFKTQEFFRTCIECKRIFWQATHRAHLEIQLSEILGELYKKLRVD